MYNILLVEDDEKIREIISYYFKKKKDNQFEVIEAKDGEECFLCLFEYIIDFQAEYFYDTELNDYVENLGFNIIAMIVVLLIVIPMYTDDFYSGTVSMIKSSKNGRKVLFISRLKITMVISTVVYVLFVATEFVTKYLLFELGNLNACITSLMIDRIADLPNSFINLSIWKFIVFLYLIYIVEAMLLAVIGLVNSKVSRENIEAFTIMSVILIGFLLIR